MVIDRSNGQQSLKISRARIATPDGGAVGVAGTMNLYKEQEIKLALVSHRFNPAALSKDYPQGTFGCSGDGDWRVNLSYAAFWIWATVPCRAQNWWAMAM